MLKRRRLAALSSAASRALPFATVSLIGVLAGCGSSAGDTSCGDFQAQSTGDQRDTVTTLLKDKDVKTDGLLGGAKISGARLAVQAFCVANPRDSKISNVTTLGG